jgi:hypothetical protein
MDAGGVSGQMSMKDVLAHLTAYQHVLVTWLDEAASGRVYVDPVLDQPDVDARNATIYERNRGRTADDVTRAFQETLDDLKICISKLTENELSDAVSTAWFVAPRWQRPQPLWQCIANDSLEHHEQHIPDIEAWLAARGHA